MPEQRRQEGPRRGPRREPRPEAEIHIDLGFGELFRGLGNFVDLLEGLAARGESEVTRTGEVRGQADFRGPRDEGGPREVRGVYGFSVKMGLGGTPSVERFGNIRATEHGPEVSEVREPLVDVFDEADCILVVAELPGVEAGDIKLEARDDILTISAEGRHRKYAREVLLPAMVAPASLRQSYQNGILEARLDRARSA